MHTNKLGLEGEQKAFLYLKKLGYKILHRNYTVKTGEIDIIAMDKKVICFIEVKTRASAEFAPPHLSVGYSKQKKYIAISKQYILLNNLYHTSVRFDIIEVVTDSINHIKNAFTC